MGKVIDSIISGTSGRTGRIVVANVNGYEISRIRPKKLSKAPTPKQALIKERFNKSVLFLASYKEYAKAFFGTKVGLRSTYNSAMSNVMNALVCDMDNLQILPNYHQIQFSKGKGIDLQPLAISSPTPLTIQIDWENNSMGSNGETDYMVALLAEDNDLNVGTQFFQTNAIRVDLTYQLSLLPRYQGKELHIWIAFVNPENLFASNSVYVGKIIVN
ncbi:MULTISPECIES: DUF6266 family protein [Empedobacter]|uniref:DUF6266 family protein n=1 Tax=Empedobacter TaxID=59734 RepID=UPI001C55AF87|nr:MULTISPECIES: DUF6266 family protein [Empedobacter]MBW1618636.1 hypothetical protein [Empedobacter falsenii]MDM1137773.1 hypothetical protein [Empedobacter sp. R132-2]